MVVIVNMVIFAVLCVLYLVTVTDPQEASSAEPQNTPSLCWHRHVELPIKVDLHVREEEHK